jgi:hypothetical protein
MFLARSLQFFVNAGHLLAGDSALPIGATCMLIGEALHL